MEANGVSRIDPMTGKVTKVALSGARNIVFGGGSAFVFGNAADQAGVYQIGLSDPPTVKGFSPLPAPLKQSRAATFSTSAIVAAGGSVWVPTYGGVWRLDETNLQHPRRIQVPIGGHFSIAAGAGAVWVVTDAGDIDRINPRTGVVTHHAVRLTGGRLAREVAFAQGALWILAITPTAAVVSEVNPGNGHTILTMQFTGAENGELTGGEQAVLSYTDTRSDRYIVKAIGPTGSTVRTLRSRAQIVGATVENGAIWAVLVGH
jgi:hypothetical protein